MIEYFTVKEETEYTVVIERSKFIAYVKNINDEEQAKAYIEEIQKRHSLANHSCYAYIADEKGLVQKFSDAGEPQGTAGMPILNVLRGNKLYKTIAVVVRYFGGIKLGTGGLSRAYGGTVSDGLKNANVIRMAECKSYEILTDYESYQKVLKAVSDCGFTVVKTDFNENVKIVVAVLNTDSYNKKFTDTMSDIFKGENVYKELKVSFCEIK